MLAYVMHLFRTEPVREVKIHPDGQHAQQIDFPGWLAKRGFRRIAPARNAFAGTFEDAEGRRTFVPWPGLCAICRRIFGKFP